MEVEIPNWKGSYMRSKQKSCDESSPHALPNDKPFPQIHGDTVDVWIWGFKYRLKFDLTQEQIKYISVKERATDATNQFRLNRLFVLSFDYLIHLHSSFDSFDCSSFDSILEMGQVWSQTTEALPNAAVLADDKKDSTGHIFHGRPRSSSCPPPPSNHSNFENNSEASYHNNFSQTSSHQNTSSSVNLTGDTSSSSVTFSFDSITHPHPMSDSDEDSSSPSTVIPEVPKSLYL